MLLLQPAIVFPVWAITCCLLLAACCGKWSRKFNPYRKISSYVPDVQWEVFVFTPAQLFLGEGGVCLFSVFIFSKNRKCWKCVCFNFRKHFLSLKLKTFKHHFLCFDGKLKMRRQVLWLQQHSFFFSQTIQFTLFNATNLFWFGPWTCEFV